MNSSVSSSLTRLSIANRILAREGVLDAFGHVSLRNPDKEGHFYLSRSRAPERVTETDILEYDLDSQPIEATGDALYIERVIHGEIYRRRPDVNAICHHHSPALMPFCLTTQKIRVVTQLGATMGKTVPVWDQRDEFGSTDNLVTTKEEASSLAVSLGAATTVLMKRHGATVVGENLMELVFRSIYTCRDAEIQMKARSHGAIDYFNDREIELASNYPEASLSRAWDYWCSRVE